MLLLALLALAVQAIEGRTEDGGLLPPLRPLPDFVGRLNELQAKAWNVDVDPSEDLMTTPSFKLKTSPMVMKESMAPTELQPNQRWMRRNDERFLCTMPTASESSSVPSQGPIADESLSKSRAAGLLHPMTEFCLYKSLGWWSYEFCYQRQIRQYHKAETASEVTDEFLLGRYDPVASDTDNIVPQQYYKQIYTEGDSCDLNNQPREVEVRIVCRPNSADEIIDVLEVATCKYLFTIGTPRLCSDAAFKHKTKPVSVIVCQLFVPDAKFLQYSAPLLPQSENEFRKLRQSPARTSNQLQALLNSMSQSLASKFPLRLVPLGDDDDISSNLQELVEQLNEELLQTDDADDDAAMSVLKHLLQNTIKKSRSKKEKDQQEAASRSDSKDSSDKKKKK